MSEEAVINIIVWGFILTAPLNAYFVYHGWALNRSVDPRSPLLRALLWVKLSVWLFNAFWAYVAFRFLNHVEPVLPFGGIGLGVVTLFILTVPFVVHTQMSRLVGDSQDRHEVRDLARDEGRDLVRDEARDTARDAEHDANGGP